MRALVWRHPVPVHGDELEFIASLGFPSPHPVHHPGYPLWVALGTAAHALGLSSYAAFAAWSCAASIIAPLLMYLGLRRMVPLAAAWWTAAAFAANPLLWFCSVTALNYSAACCVSLMIVGESWQAVVDRRADRAVRAAILLSFGAFLRADLLIWLGPLVLYSAWRTGAVRRVIGTLAVGFILLISTTWLLYRAPASASPAPSLVHTLDVVLGTSVFRLGLVDGLARSALKLATNLGWDFGLGAVVLAAILCRMGRITRARPGVALFLTLWVLPLGLFFLLVHMSEPTHVLLLIPAGYVFLSIGLCELVPRRAVAVLITFTCLSVAQFTAWPWSAGSSGWKRLLDAKIGYISAAGLRRIDQRGLIHRPGDFWPTAAHAPP